MVHSTKINNFCDWWCDKQNVQDRLSRSPLWSDTAWLALRRNTWWNCAILLAQPSVGNVSGRLLVVTSLFRGFGFRHSAIGPSLSQAPKFGTLFRSGLDNRVTIYCFSNRNWKRIYFSSSERFCGSISNEGPYKFSILLLLPLLSSMLVGQWSFIKYTSQNSNPAHFVCI